MRAKIFRSISKVSKMSSPGSSQPAKRKVAVVTGANRGIGFQIVKNLCQRLDSNIFDVILTARNEQSGLEAAQHVASAVTPTPASAPKFHQLDIDNVSSTEQLRKHLVETYGGLDILVQNAAVYVRNTESSFATIAEQTMKTNYWSVRDICRILMPVMRDGGSLVLLASRMGQIFLVKDEKTRKRLVSTDLKMDELDELMQSYIDGVKRREHASADAGAQEKVWDESVFSDKTGPYSVSKLGVIALARILQREVDAGVSGKKAKILVTSCSPGYVATDMTDFKGERTVEEGADTPTYLALLPMQEQTNGDALPLVKGMFIHDRQVVDWESYKRNHR